MVTNSLPRIRPLSDLRTHMGEITEHVDQEHTPVILTKHGRDKYVLLSAESYRELIAEQELCRLLDEGLDDIKQGRTQELSAAMKDLRKANADR